MWKAAHDQQIKANRSLNITSEAVEKEMSARVRGDPMPLTIYQWSHCSFTVFMRLRRHAGYSAPLCCRAILSSCLVARYE